MVNIVTVLSKAERIARYRSGNITNTVENAVTNLTSKVENATTQAVRTARKAKYKAQFEPLTVDTFAPAPLSKTHENILNNFSRYVGKSVDDVPIEDCIKLQELLVGTFRNGSIKPPYGLTSKLPFLSDNPKEYLSLLKKLDERIATYTTNFRLKPFSASKMTPLQSSTYNSLSSKNRTITDFIHSLEGKSVDEATLLINSQANKLGLSNTETIELFRLFETRGIIQHLQGQVTPQEMQRIAYRIGSEDKLKVLSLLEPSFCKANESALKPLIKQVENNALNLAQTSNAEILNVSKLVNIGGHKVQVCNIEDIPNLSGYFHTPQGWGDSLNGLTENDIYRRFANFKYVFNRPTNGNPICYTYGTNGKYPLWSYDNGFFVNVPKRNVHVGSTTGLGSECNGLDSCIDKFAFLKDSCFVNHKLAEGHSIDEIVNLSIKGNCAPEYLCTNASIQAFYTNDISTMNKAYIELAEQYNIPIINLNGKGILPK